ncbi:GntR family transcriptional regulator [Pseudoprimorskyibacter insulae]|uniref:HTH-type transcriptional repressor RspR n=1 Tax=Pseudoprimorskyibacter insulae TaxID=1695997 RepID=A0A2R8AQ94_9RHOB|nr:GntR family transcriptional regulator [Pseudoprimorskyibacter insulae]SPF78029.1 HTH-type transcriptional repressor RspR [Pseudoprimorskyibacter insulae]
MVEQTLPDQIARQLRRDILRGKLAPGMTIKERDNAAEIGVSRTPMREAIRLLAREGLVILRPSRSPIVANPSLQDVTDWIEVLRALELLSGKLACERASDKEISEIEKLQQKMETSYDQMDPLDLFELDMQFHIAIARASHNPSLAETHSAYLARLWRARYLSAVRRRSRDRVLRQHWAIVEGLSKRDPDHVRTHLDSHLEHLLVNIQDKFEQEAKEAEATEKV